MSEPLPPHGQPYLQQCILAGLIHQQGRANPNLVILQYGQGLIGLAGLVDTQGKPLNTDAERFNRVAVAHVLAEAGHLLAADQELTLATTIRNTDFDAREYLARVRLADGDPLGAAHALLPCTLFPPYNADPEAHLRLAKIQFDLRKYRAAIRSLDRCLALDVTRTDAELLRGDAYRRIISLNARDTA